MTIHKQRSIWIRVVALIAIAFGLLTIKEGGAVLFVDGAARAAARNYVPFVLWFNFLAGFAYVIAGVGLWMRRRWAMWLAVAIAATSAFMFAAFGLHVAFGGAWEQRTLIAMSLRTLVWVGIATLAWRHMAPHTSTGYWTPTSMGNQAMKTPHFSAGKTRWLVIGVVVIVTAGLLSFWFLCDDKNENVLRLYGNVDIREVELFFRQPGRVASMAFDEGDNVTAGAVMATLDATPYREKVAAAEAELQATVAGLDKLHGGNRPQEIVQAREKVRQAQAVSHEAARNFNRQSSLLGSGAISQRDVDSARAARDQSAANLAAAKAALSLATAGFRSEDIAAGGARVAAAEAALAQARTALADTDLVAPSDATVLTRVREPGSMVASNTPVYSLSLRDPVYVRAYISEPNLGRIAPGTKVQVHTDSSTATYHGQIGFISPRAEFTPKTVETTDLRTDLVYRLRIVVADADQGLRQGMPVTVDVNTEPITDERAGEQ